MMRRDPPLRLLLVEDDAEAGAELAELLEVHGASVSLAATAGEALRLAASESPDMALVDLELGTDSGADLAAHWHGAPGMPVVVLLSGRSLTPAEAARFREGSPPLLGKPLDLLQLLAAVDRLLP